MQDDERNNSTSSNDSIPQSMFNRSIADWLNTKGMGLSDEGRKSWARRVYRLATLTDPTFGSSWYNLGLLAKYSGNWSESLRANRKAVDVDPHIEAAWWNLGIAATALRDWDEARRAWNGYGIELADGQGEVMMPRESACIRLNPQDSGEVVWGTRLDPARTVLLNVPLPESGHRFHDVVLNDGAPNGSRTDSDGTEVPVFDELAVWEKSKYSTFEAHILIPNENVIESLIDLCCEHEMGVEDWSSIRFICKQCSLGSPGPHEHRRDTNDVTRTLAFGARNRNELMTVLVRWATENGDVEMLLNAQDD